MAAIAYGFLITVLMVLVPLAFVYFVSKEAIWLLVIFCTMTIFLPLLLPWWRWFAGCMAGFLALLVLVGINYAFSGRHGNGAAEALGLAITGWYFVVVLGSSLIRLFIVWIHGLLQRRSAQGTA